MITGLSSLSILIYAAALLGIILLSRLLIRPIKFLLKLFLNSVAGCILILIINTFWSSFGFQIAINAITLILCAFLGVSGVVFLAAFNLIL